MSFKDFQERVLNSDIGASCVIREEQFLSTMFKDNFTAYPQGARIFTQILFESVKANEIGLMITEGAQLVTALNLLAWKDDKSDFELQLKPDGRRLFCSPRNMHIVNVDSQGKLVKGLD